MYRIAASHPVQSLTLSQARRIVADLDTALSVSPQTRLLAFNICSAARRGRPCPVLVLVAGTTATHPEPPKDAA